MVDTVPATACVAPARFVVAVVRPCSAVVTAISSWRTRDATDSPLVPLGPLVPLWPPPPPVLVPALLAPEAPVVVRDVEPVEWTGGHEVGRLFREHGGHRDGYRQQRPGCVGGRRSRGGFGR